MKLFSLCMTVIISISCSRTMVMTDAEQNIVNKYEQESYGSATPIHFAVMKNDLRAVKLLLNNGHDINHKTEVSNLRHVGDFGGHTPLHYTVIEGSYEHDQKEMVNLLINKGINLDIQDVFGRTALIWASINVYSDIAILIIKSGAEIDIADKKERTALYYATQNDHDQIIEALKKNKKL